MAFMVRFQAVGRVDQVEVVGALDGDDGDVVTGLLRLPGVGRALVDRHDVVVEAVDDDLVHPIGRRSTGEARV